MPTQPFAIPATFFFFVALPLVIGLIPRNRFFGIRTQKALVDDQVWYPVNRFGGIMVMLASMIYAIIAITQPYSKSASDDFTVWLIHLAGFGLPLLFALVLTLLYSRNPYYLQSPHFSYYVYADVNGLITNKGEISWISKPSLSI